MCVRACMHTKDIKSNLIKWQVFNALLLPTAVMLFVRESELCPLLCESFTFFDWHLLSHSPVPSSFQIVHINAIIQHLSFALKPIIATIWQQIAWFLPFACWILFHHEGVPYFYLFIHLTVDTCTSVSRLLWNEALTSLSSRPTRGMAAFTQTLLRVSISRTQGVTFPTPLPGLCFLSRFQ